MDRRVRRAGRPQFNPTYHRPQPRGRVRRINFSGWQARAVVGLVVIALLIVLLQDSFAINNVVVTPATRSEQLTQETRKALGQWGQGNLLTFDSSRLVTDLVAADPAISAVQVERQWPHGLRLTVADKVASLGWQTGGATYVLDSGGSIIGQAPSGSKLLVVHDDTNLPVKSGQHVAPSAFVAFCQQLSLQLPGLGLKLVSLDIHETTIDLYVKTDKGYSLILDTTRPVGDQINQLKRTLAALSSQHKTPSEYIDVRIDGRAYYK